MSKPSKFAFSNVRSCWNTFNESRWHWFYFLENKCSFQLYYIAWSTRCYGRNDIFTKELVTEFPFLSKPHQLFRFPIWFCGKKCSYLKGKLEFLILSNYPSMSLSKWFNRILTLKFYVFGSKCSYYKNKSTIFHFRSQS